MYKQNLTHNKLSINSSWNYQKYLSQMHICAFFLRSIVLSHPKTQCYIKTTLNSWKGKTYMGTANSETLLLLKLALTLPNPHKNPDTSPRDRQKWSEGGRHQAAWGAAALRVHLPASPHKPLWGLTLTHLCCHRLRLRGEGRSVPW